MIVVLVILGIVVALVIGYRIARMLVTLAVDYHRITRPVDKNR